MKRSLNVLAYGTKLLVSVGGLWFVMEHYGLWHRLPQILGQQGPWIALGLVFCLVQTAFAGLRWDTILRALGIVLPRWHVLCVFYVTAFLNSFLPAGLAGDVVRVWLLRNNAQGVAPVVNSVIIDRIVVLLTLLVAAAVMQPAIWMQSSTMLTSLIIGFAAAALLGLYGMLLLVPYVPLAEIRWLGPPLAKLTTDMRLVFFRLSSLRKTVALSLASNLLLIAAVYSLGLGLDLKVGIVNWLVVMPVVLLVTALPVSVGGWGTRELTMVYMLGLFGVPAEQAVAVSIEFGLCSTVASLAGAPIWLTLRQPRVAGTTTNGRQ